MGPLNRLADDALKSSAANGSNHSIEQSDSEDVLGTWLKENGVPNAWKIAPILVGAGVESDALASLRELPPALSERHPMDSTAVDDPVPAR